MKIEIEHKKHIFQTFDMQKSKSVDRFGKRDIIAKYCVLKQYTRIINPKVTVATPLILTCLRATNRGEL